MKTDCYHKKNHGRYQCSFWLLWLMLLFSPTNIYALVKQFNYVGDDTLDYPSDADEEQQDQAMMASLKNQLIVDPLTDVWINQIEQRLAEAANLNAPPHVYILLDPTLNAFTLANHAIFVNTGLLQIIGQESELAALLSHETGHLVRHHFSRTAAEASALTTSMIVGGGLGLLALLAGYGDLGMATALGSFAAVDAHVLRFSRQNEEEADAWGMKTLVAAGYDPGGMAQLFATLNDFSQHSDASAVPFLNTHPLTQDRLLKAQLAAQRLGRILSSDHLSFWWLQGRIDYLIQTKQQRLSYQKILIQPISGSPSAWRSQMAWLSAALQHPEQNVDLKIKNIIASMPDDAPEKQLFAWAYLLGYHQLPIGFFEQAWSFIENNPQQPDFGYYLLVLLLSHQQTSMALRLIDRWQNDLTAPPDELYLWQARIENSIGHTAEAYAAQAEWATLQRQWPLALHGYQTALQQKPDCHQSNCAFWQAEIKRLSRFMPTSQADRHKQENQS